MVAPALVAAVASKAPAILGALKGGIGALGSKLGGFLSSGTGKGLLNIGGNLSNYAGGLFGGKDNNAAAKAYQAYVTRFGNNMAKTLEQRGQNFENKLLDNFNTGESEYLNEANTQLPELTQLIQDIANQSAEAQRQNQRQINASLAQQGVRGGQAAILANRATGELNRDLQRDINQTAYNEAANRQNSRLNYYTNKATTPYNTLNSTYGNVMGGAYGALNNAQGGALTNAYNAQLANYGNTIKSKKKFGLF